MGRSDRRRSDHYTARARSRGYPARSVFKLEQIDRTHHLLGSRIRVLDLGAAPGSWSAYASERLGTQGLVVAVDLAPVELPGRADGAPVERITGDFTDRETRSQIAAYAPFDVVMSDAAPATTGNRVLDTARSEALVESVLVSLDDWLRPGGHLLCKIFQGAGQKELIVRARRSFRQTALVRPDAVRRESFEAYLVGRRFLGGSQQGG